MKTKRIPATTRILPEHPSVHASVFLAMFLISIGYPVGEEIAGDLDTGVLMLMRFALAAAVFAPIVA